MLNTSEQRRRHVSEIDAFAKQNAHVSESVPTVLRAMMNQPSRMMSSLLRNVTLSLPMIQNFLIPFGVLKSMDCRPIGRGPCVMQRRLWTLVGSGTSHQMKRIEL